MTIKSDCNTECTEYAFLNITDSIFSFPTSGVLFINFINLIIGRESIDSSYILYATDKKNSTNNCPQVDFLNLIKITPKAKFYIENATFQNIRYNVRSIINAEDCRLELYNTNFINISTFYCPGEFPVISLFCNSSCLASSFIYNQGNVSLNNGYFNKFIKFGSNFLSSTGFKNIKISNVEFANIIFSRDLESVGYIKECIVYIYDCKQAYLTNNKFNYIYSQSELINIIIDPTYENWAATVIVDNNQFNSMWLEDSLLSVYMQSEFSYIFISTLNISRSLSTSSIVALEGVLRDSEAVIKNIWITNSLFYHLIKSRNTTTLNISSLYVKNLVNSIWSFHYYYGVDYPDDIINLGADSYEDTEWTLIDSKGGAISISNIKIGSDLFFDYFGVTWYFANIYRSNNFLLKNIEIYSKNYGADTTIYIDETTQSTISNVYLSEWSTIYILDSFKTTIFSSYLNKSSIFMETANKDDDALLIVYNTLFEESFVFIGDWADMNTYQFINCTFYNMNNEYFESDVAIFSTYIQGDENLIITKNCHFKFNKKMYLLKFEGGNYQDFNSVFEGNDYLLYAKGWENLTCNYVFKNSEFYDNNPKNLIFDIVYGVVEFSNCVFLRNGSLRIGPYLFIENSTFINNTAENSPFLQIKGNQSSIMNSYFENNDGISIINNSSSILEIYNSVFYSWSRKNNLIETRGSGELLIFNSSFKIHSHQIIIYSEGDRIAKIQNSYFEIKQPLGSISFFEGSIYLSNITMIEIEPFVRAESTNYPSFFYSNKSDILNIKDSNFYNWSHNAIYLINTHSISIAKSKFKSRSKGRALEIIDHLECNLTDVQFMNNTESSTGGSILFTNKLKNSYTIIDNCEFIGNSAYDFGGAIVIDGCGVIIKNSRFINNTSLYYGGAITSVCKISNLANYLMNNIFYNNNATVGGAVYWEINYQDTSNNTFLNNSAIYGNNTASYPIKLDIIKQPYSFPNENAKLKCGGDEINFKVALIDQDNQIVSYGYNQPTLVSYGYNWPTDISNNQNNVAIVGKFEVDNEEGVYFFRSLRLLCSPGRSIFLNLSYTDEFHHNFEYDMAYDIPMIKIIVNTSGCEVGEHWTEDRCEYCTYGTFSLWIETQCEWCPNNAECFGGDKLAPLQGYWRGDYDRSTIYACPNPNACKGGVNETDNYVSWTGICAEGYRGNLCQPCDFNYSSSGRNECEKCPADQGKNAVKIIVILVIACILLTLISYFSLKTAYEPKSTISIYFRILINYLQMITLIARLKLNWPFYIDYWLTNQGYPGEVPTHIVSIDCYLMDINDPDSYKSIYFKKMVFITILPAILGAAAFLFWSFIAIFQRNWKMMKNELIATLCILLFLILPSVTDYMFSIYSCMYIYDDLFLVRNLDIMCWEDDHSYSALNVAFPGIIVWTIAAPACLFLFLYKNRFKLHKLDTKLRFGFLYNGYRGSTYYWEFILMIRKFMIIALSVFLTTKTIEIQTASFAFVFTIFYYIQNKYYPYEYENLNKTELSSNFVILITTWCGLFYTADGINVYLNAYFFPFLILSTNVYFIFMWTRTMIFELKVLFVEFSPFFKNYIDCDGLKIKKGSETKPIFSLINQNEDVKIVSDSENRIESSLDLSIFAIKENLKFIEERKSQQSDESSGELSVTELFASEDIEEDI